jgi:UDP-glucuronate decarboxylase
MKTVVITGAAGFLGSHLSNRFLNAGWRVIGIDDFSTALGRSAPHFVELSLRNNFIFYAEDICELQPALFGMRGVGKIDLILNFACPASPPRYQAIPIKTMMTCVWGVDKMLRLAHQHKCPIVHASTSEVYGDPEISPQAEEYRGVVNSYGPRACYDEGKRAAEALCYDWTTKFGVDARLVRIFNTYGPHMDPNDGRVVSNFITQALNDDPLTIYGSGEQTRSFCYVDDLVEGIYRVSQLPAGRLNGPVNLGNPHEFTIIQLANVVAAVLNKKHLITFEALPVDDPRQRKPDITKARLLLDGWEPQVELRYGIEKSVDWFKRVLHIK